MRCVIEMNVTDQRLRMESEKCKAFRYFNKISLELGEIIQEQYLDEEKKIMMESIEKMKLIIKEDLNNDKMLY